MENKKFSAFSKAVVAIEPTNFDYNDETGIDNKFQNKVSLTKEQKQEKAHKCWESAVYILEQNNIEVKKFKQCRKEAIDSIWPDWFTTNKNELIPDGAFIIYPMKCESRRMEKESEEIKKELKKRYKNFIDLSYLEKSNDFLEGKGSVIFDIRNAKIYVNISERSTENGVKALIENLNKISLKPWRAVTWRSSDENNNAIYHTDCMLTLFEKHALVCLDSIKDNSMRQNLIEELCNPAKNINGGYEIMDISFTEMKSMCCNIFNLNNSKGESIIMISSRARKGYKPEHFWILQKYYKIIVADLDFVEDVGGGSARCILAELW